MFKISKKFFYIILFGILWLITAFSSFFHAVEFFELSNITWMSVILALAFEIGQASTLMSILTSKQNQKKYTPWVLMCILTLVQIIGNVYSSYKYIMLNSPENLKYFKEPIFIWTQLPDDQATVIVTYVSAAILPIVALLMTAMITNYLSDQEELKNDQKEDIDNPETECLNEQQEIDNLNVALDKKDEEISKIKQELEELKSSKEINNDTEKEDAQQHLSSESQSDNLGERHVETETITPEDTKSEDIEISSESDKQFDEQVQEQQLEENIQKRESHFINL